MAGSQRPGKKMVSNCNPAMERCTLAFNIVGYSLLKGLDVGEFIRSVTYSVTSHDWCIWFFPNGDAHDGRKGYVSVYLELMSDAAEALACFDFMLVDQTTGLSNLVFENPKGLMPFTSASPTLGFPKFKKSYDLEASSYIKDDRLVIECDMTVMLGTPVVSASETFSAIKVPSTELPNDLGKLLGSKKRTDVRFKVKGGIFHAHKLVIVMRSPVFEAELYGPMRDKRRSNVKVEDMQPSIFKALLHFIYTDSLPAMDDDLSGESSTEMVEHLLVVVDRYALERMKLMCESILCKRHDVENVASALALADEYYCTNLKDAYIGFMNSLERVDAVSRADE